MTMKKSITLPDNVGELIQKLAVDRAKKEYGRDNFSKEITARLVRTLKEDGLLPDEGSEKQ